MTHPASAVSYRARRHLLLHRVMGMIVKRMRDPRKKRYGGKRSSAVTAVMMMMTLIAVSTAVVNTLVRNIDV